MKKRNKDNLQEIKNRKLMDSSLIEIDKIDNTDKKDSLNLNNYIGKVSHFDEFAFLNITIDYF